MKKISLLVLCLLVLLCVCGCDNSNSETNYEGKYSAGYGNDLELFASGRCSYSQKVQSDVLEYNDCTYDITSSNEVRVEYSYYDKKYSDTFDIVDNKTLEDRYGTKWTKN